MTTAPAHHHVQPKNGGFMCRLSIRRNKNEVAPRYRFWFTTGDEAEAVQRREILVDALGRLGLKVNQRMQAGHRREMVGPQN